MLMKLLSDLQKQKNTAKWNVQCVCLLGSAHSPGTKIP